MLTIYDLKNNVMLKQPDFLSWSKDMTLLRELVLLEVLK